MYILINLRTSMLFCKKYFFYTIILKTVKIMKKIVLNFFLKTRLKLLTQYVYHILHCLQFHLKLQKVRRRTSNHLSLTFELFSVIALQLNANRHATSHLYYSHLYRQNHIAWKMLLFSSVPSLDIHERSPHKDVIYA